MKTVGKAMAYITRGTQLLVLEHVGIPEAGIQVPAGTIKPGESPADAALREAREETGLTTLTPDSFLGEYVRDMRDYGKDEFHHRYVFHLIAPLDSSDKWEHREYDPSDGSRLFYHFSFYWVELPDNIPGFIGGHGRLIPELLARLRALGVLGR